MFWKRRPKRKRIEQLEKILFGYDFALENIDEMIGKMKKLTRDGIASFERGKTIYDVAEIEARFSAYKEVIGARKHEVEDGTADFRKLADEMNRVAEEIQEIYSALKIKNHDTAVGCLFVWAPLDTQADIDEGIFVAPN